MIALFSQVVFAAPLAGYGTGYVALGIMLLGIAAFLLIFSLSMEKFFGVFTEPMIPFFIRWFILLLAGWVITLIVAIANEVAKNEDYTSISKLMDSVFTIVVWFMVIISILYLAFFGYFGFKAIASWGRKNARFK